MIRSLNPIQRYSCFISDNSKDTPLAERLHADLQKNSARCCFAPEDLNLREKIRIGIEQSIRVQDELLLVLSELSIRSGWVNKEVQAAMEQERKQKRTVCIDNAVLKFEDGWQAEIRRWRNLVDLRGWGRTCPKGV